MGHRKLVQADRVLVRAGVEPADVVPSALSGPDPRGLNAEGHMFVGRQASMSGPGCIAVNADADVLTILGMRAVER